MKNLSVIIVSYNTQDLLRRGIESALPQLDLEKDELIIVDNNSPDGTAQMVRDQFPQVKLLALDKDYGYAYGGNRGFEGSQGRDLFIMSSDIVLPPDTLVPMIEKLRSRPDVGVLCPESIDFNGSLKQLSWQWKVSLWGELFNKLFSPKFIARYSIIRHFVPMLQKKEKVVPWVSGAAFMIRREVMEKIKGFDEHFQLYYEDTDLFVRVREAGYSNLFDPKVKVFHGLGESTKNEQSKAYLMFIQSRLYYYKKHLSATQHALLKQYLKLKFLMSPQYKKGSHFRNLIDFILAEQGTIPLWENIQI